MDKKVYVSVKGTTLIDGEEDVTELVTEGEMIFRGGKYLLKYKEQLSDDGFEYTTMIKIDTNTVVMTRTGSSSTQMVFECGKKHTSHYETPMGSFTICVSTDMLQIDVKDDGGYIRIDYVLDINNITTVENKLVISIHKDPVATERK
ncbi:MAG: DUF1934 domain-containing protein [Clostridia bacterium]